MKPAMRQNTSTAVMQRRTEARDSLDDFPTPPWATRALVEHVIGRERVADLSVWEPACNRGHMAKPLKEYFRRVYTSDIHDYSTDARDFCQDRVVDFLWPGSESPVIAAQGLDWIITNPPFRLAEQFIERAFDLKPRAGVAVILRTAFLEGIGRHDRLFKDRPPAIVAQFAERVPMVRGRLDQEAVSATAYCWIVWMVGGIETKLMWIPPCRKQLERADEYDPQQALAPDLRDTFEQIWNEPYYDEDGKPRQSV